ncbi:hypothetical protein P154DRAFT_499701 [Amniculicola lignicola CBS 123094]|uniref:37S ribosomal protein-like protein Rsm22 n=1 Tax=Amniculicola lignicola CBS 123094 TaxID=1392246 RepID=A0A6A5W3N3_9PLEO|nr:hypothetical protein P154DRAFT_499701 [Amniculicola lignicola CBS 123094]
MLTAKSIPSVCLSCRLNILATRARNAHPSIRPNPLRSTRAPTLSTRFSPRWIQSQRRPFTTTPHTEPALHDVEDVQPPPPQLSVEESVRRARQLYGDALPKGHLSEEAYTLYERLYGTPVLVETAEELKKSDGQEGDLFEAELADGSPVLYRRGEDGELEEVEIFEDVEEDAEDKEGGMEGEEVEVEKDITMTEEEWAAYREQKAHAYHQQVYEQSRLAHQDEVEDIEEFDEEEAEFMRAHPLTVAGRFKPSPSTVFLPKETFVDPIATLLTRANHKHLAETSNRIFGGPGLPYSATTASASQSKEQKPIPLDASQTDMGNIEGDVYLAAVMPGTYATVMSALVEVRRRLGSEWIERLLNRKSGALILDAGAGGAGILAWHEIIKAEWARMHEESEATSQGDAPLGKATVLAGSDMLRHRASKLLENTTFIPRLPDEISKVEEEVNTQQPRKQYDLIIAPHTLWNLRQEYLRKEQVEKYWSLLNPKGGVLVIMEKGLPRGFEVVAAARQHLLDKHIASPGSEEIEVPLEDQISNTGEDTRTMTKEMGMIIAPCTNHAPCPMYQSPGISSGRKDFCFFSQRYIRPPYLQRILNANDQNHEDVQFSYVAVQRGRDQRLPLHDILGKGLMQSEDTANKAFEGYEWASTDPESEELLTPADVNTLSLPRLILPPLKRRGHIILDVCTPAGKLERWTVPRSFSKQAFRDARKSRWGDLWALGAKTRIPRNVRLGRPRDEFDRKGRRIKAPKETQVVEIPVSTDGTKGEPRMRRDGRDGRGLDRKIRGSGGRKGRKGGKTRNVLDDLDD